MKAVILCAGKGKRLRPFSYSIPKHLLPVCNQPVLGYLLEELSSTCQVNEVAMIVSKETINPIQEYLSKKRADLPFHFTYLFQDQPLGLANACSMAEKFVSGDEFMMLLGDNIIPGGIQAILDPTLETDLPDTTILVRPVADPTPYGVVEFDNEHRVISMEEKPAKPKSSYVIVGIYRFKPSIFSSIQQIKPSQRGELEITDAIFHQVQTGKKVKVKIFEGTFLDIGSPQSYLSANQYIIEHYNQGSSIDESSVVRNSSIDWNVSIGEKSEVLDSELTNCIVMAGTKINKSKLKNSIMGRNCQIKLNNLSEKATELIVGDDSLVTREK